MRKRVSTAFEFRGTVPSDALEALNSIDLNAGNALLVFL